MANVLIMTPAPLYRRWPTTPDTTKMATNAAPATLPQLAACLPGHNVKIYDGNVCDIPLYEYAGLIKWADIAAINVMSSYAALNTELNVRFIKMIKPAARVVLGGHHATFQAKEWLSRGADVVVRREGEITFQKTVEALKNPECLKEVKGISFVSEEEIFHNPDRPFIENLDDLPMPRWDLMNFGGYYLYMRKKGYSACLETSRGCEQVCSFCQVGPMWKHTHRFKSPGRVIEEMRVLKKLGVTQVFIVDDNYGSCLDASRQARIYEMMRKGNFNFEWGGFFRHDFISANHGLLKEAAASGMKFACIGFESVKGEDLNAFNKRNAAFENAASYEREYKFLKSLGIVSFGFIIIGYPGQSENSALMTLKDARRFCDYPVVTLYKPLPGTAGYVKTEKEGLLAKKMFYHDSFTVAVRGTKPVLAAYNRFFLKYLLNPARVLKRLFDKNLRPVEAAVYLWFIKGIFNANPGNVSDFFWFVFKGRGLPEEEVIEYLRRKYLSGKNLKRLAGKGFTSPKAGK